MSDTGNEKSVVSTEEEEGGGSFTPLPAVKLKRQRSLSGLRHPRQKFCARWEKDFPWLRGDKIDESLGICTVCDKRLVCKKSHLERHQKSFKHQRHSGFDDTEGDSTQPIAPEFLECGKREKDDDDDDDDDDDIELSQTANLKPISDVEFELDPIKRIKQKSVKRSAQHNLKSSAHMHKSNSNKLDRMKLLKRIDRERQELNEYYYSRRRQLSPAPQVQQPARDSFDLFFESVSASVKTLPPKLAAEVKGRVSQIIADFEMRAICEREAFLSANNDPTMVVASTTRDSAQEILPDAGTPGASTAVPHIMYTFQPK